MSDLLATESPAELNDEQIDELVDSSEKSRSRDAAERPMSSQPEAKPVEDKYELNIGGKKISGTREQVLKWAQQGYDYPQKLQAFNQQKSAWEQERQGWEKNWSPYRQVDDWARKNPDQWNKLQQTWKQMQSGQPVAQGQPQGQAPMGADVQALLAQHLQPINQFMQQTLQERQAMQVREEDQKLDQEIKSIQDKYSDLDFGSPDDNGKSLEMKVLEHAQANGIKSFKTAFLDFYHDQLQERAIAQAKAGFSKGIQNRTKLGVLGQSPTQKREQFQTPKNIKDTSYEEIEREIRDELASMSR